MRNKKTATAGVVCGLACALSVLAYTQSVNNQAQQARADALARYGGEQVEVCVASRDLSAGEVINSDAIEKRSWIVDFLPSDVVRNPEEIVGKQLGSSILEGEPISLQRFEGKAESLDVPSDMVAISVPAGDVQSVGGQLGPGSRVDVYTTGSTTTRLLSDVLVLATSTESGEVKSTTSWVTLAVDPSRVQELVDAAQKTEFYFSTPAQPNEKEEE